MNISTLKGSSILEIQKAFNHAFSDYSIPFTLTEESLNQKIMTENIQLDLSVGAYDGNKLVGFILHGSGQIHNAFSCYNGGTGVIPSHRGNNLTVQMYDYIIPILKKRNYQQAVLEVLANNTAAIKSYERIGYKHFRTLNCYHGEPSRHALSREFIIEELSDVPWGKLSKFITTQPSWQNSIASLKRDNISHKCYGVYREGELIACSIYNPRINKLHFLATQVNHRRQGAARALLNHVVLNSDPGLKIINVPDGDLGLNSLILSSGMELFIQQREMTMVLS